MNIYIKVSTICFLFLSLSACKKSEPKPKPKPAKKTLERTTWEYYKDDDNHEDILFIDSVKFTTHGRRNGQLFYWVTTYTYSHDQVKMSPGDFRSGYVNGNKMVLNSIANLSDSIIYYKQ